MPCWRSQKTIRHLIHTLVPWSMRSSFNNKNYKLRLASVLRWREVVLIFVSLYNLFLIELVIFVFFILLFGLVSSSSSSFFKFKSLMKALSLLCCSNETISFQKKKKTIKAIQLEFGFFFPPLKIEFGLHSVPNNN